MCQPRLLFLATALNVLLATDCFGGVTIDQGVINSLVYRQSDGAIKGVNLPGPTDGTTLATLTDSFFSSTARTIDDSGISISFVQSRNGAYGDNSSGYAYANFTPDVDTPFFISGNFGNANGYGGLYGQVYDFSTGEVLFEQSSFSYGPLFAQFGAFSGTTTINGSLFGVLLAGHQYSFYVSAGTYAYGTNDSASASGTARLQFGDVPTEVVPEPASLAVWSCLGLTAIGGAWWQKRRSL